MKLGDKVTVTVYGVQKSGVISRGPRNGIVFVRMDDSGGERWFHVDSLNPPAPTESPRPELSFDGFGINGPDEFRTRLATFDLARWTPEQIQKYGRLFEAAPELLAALQGAVDQMEQCEKMFRDDSGFMDALADCRAAIASTRGKS